MFEIDTIVIVDVIIVILAFFAFYYSAKIMMKLNHVNVIGWWTVLPLVFLYGLANRITVLLCALDVSPMLNSETIAALTLPFWIGIFIFVRGLYKSVDDLKEIKQERE